MPRNSRTGGQHVFSQIPRANIQRSVFNRSHGLKTGFNAGFLIPIFVDEFLPGDSVDLKMSNFGRLPALLYPVMENIYLDFFFFAVPNRLLWSNWKKLNGEQTNPGDVSTPTTFLVPQVTAPGGGFAEGSLFDFMGIPTKIAGIAPSALFARAYNLIYNEWFRDENLVNSATVPLTDGPDADTLYPIRRRGKRHDYFTSCLPWPQKGAAANLGATVAVEMVAGNTNSWTANLATTGLVVAAGSLTTTAAGVVQGGTGPAPVKFDPRGTLVANLSTITINQLRESFQVQRVFERDARGGTRYTEILRSHFGVISPDARLQRPEYLGGGTARINVNQIASTNSRTDASQGDLALGELGAFATVASSGIGFRRSFTEHGVIIGLACLRADLNYQQGMERQFSRRSRFDFFWPALAHLGEQPVLNKEIYAQGTAADTNVFGYQERYAEYRYKPSMITSIMRSNAATPLDAWHLAQEFTALPVLNQSFIEENPPFDRIVAVNATISPHCILDCFFEYKCARPMPVYGVPGLIDHF